MYSRMLIPLDGSKTAEKVLPYARSLAKKLKIPVELMAVIDIAEMAMHVSPERARYLDTLVQEGIRSSQDYLKNIAGGFSGLTVTCTVDKGRAEDAIIEGAAKTKDTLIAMATHGRSGMKRWMLGSVAEKVLRGASNPLLLIRAEENAPTEGDAAVKSVIVPLDGSDLAESVLPMIIELAKTLKLEVVLFRAYNIPANTYAGVEDYYAVNYEQIRAEIKTEAQGYLEKKVEELKRKGVESVSYVLPEGYAADEIIALGRKTPDNLIAMCTHGRTGVKRWVLGSVTEKVVRHSGDPVLILRAP